MRRSRSASLVLVVWVVIGVVVAANHHYFSGLKTLGSFLSALLAIQLQQQGHWRCAGAFSGRDISHRPERSSTPRRSRQCS
jgi:hypothetical protein